jgi:hypothetical protein
MRDNDDGSFQLPITSRSPILASTPFANILCTGCDGDNPLGYVNYHAFIANLFEYRIVATDPTYAISAMRRALEGDDSGREADTRDYMILCAAQWIIWYGQSLFKQILYPGDIRDDLRPWSAGPLYDGKPLLTLHRWHFWKDGFKAIEGEDERSDECKRVAAKAADLMACIEKNLTF